MAEDGPMVEVESDALGQARGRREELGRAADVLEHELARPGRDPSWTLRVAESLQGLDRAFRAHCVEVEADDGLLPQLRNDAPRLIEKINHVQDEHPTISAAIDQAIQLVHGCAGDCGAEAVESIREVTVDVLRTISRHRQKGADLVYEAYEVDIGGGG